MKRDWNAMAQGILDAVGGPENISGMTHCATRLRLNLKDDAAELVRELFCAMGR